MPTLDELKATYAKLSDSKLLKIASQEAGSLTPEGLEVLKAEVRKRGLADELSAGIDVQTTELTVPAMEEYIDLVRSQPCPLCGRTDSKLNGTVAAQVISFIVLSQYTKRPLIGCPTCLVNKNKTGLGTSLALGWWGIPWGIVYTIKSIIFNNKMIKQAQQSAPNETLLRFVASNVGAIEIAKNNPEKMNGLLLNFKL